MNGQRTSPPRFQFVHHQQMKRPKGGTHSGGMACMHILVTVGLIPDVLLWVVRNALGRPFLPSFRPLGCQHEEQMYVGLGW
jgi:hypothetical protein